MSKRMVQVNIDKAGDGNKKGSRIMAWLRRRIERRGRSAAGVR